MNEIKASLAERYPEAKFDKDHFMFHGGYLTYVGNDYRDEFIARFKYSGGMTTMGIFKRALRLSGLSPLQYLELLKDRNNTPVGILVDNGILRFDYDNMATYVNGKLARKLG